MSGTTLCPHCNTRFKIDENQLEAHQGMVRCGHCMQAFDARPGYLPDQPHPQLELPILDEPVVPSTETEGSPPAQEDQPTEQAAPEETAIPEEPPGEGETAVTEAAADMETPPQEAPPEEPAASEQTNAEPQAEEPAALTLAEQVAIVQDEAEEEQEPPAKPLRWPWAIGAFLLLLLLLAQATYFLRVDLAARVPALKPVLEGYCKLLKCSIPLPRKADLMSIESSDLEADPAHENHITLNALLRNRATFTQAFPDIELSLTDTDDKPLARRSFTPRDYLPPQEKEQAGLQPNHEVIVKLYLNTSDLRPTGYRLALYYPAQ